MVTDEQVRRLRKLSNTEKNQEIAASKAGMDPTTARRYLGLGRLPSELKKERQWRTREDPFGEVWEAVERQIEESPGLEAKTLFEWLQRDYQEALEVRKRLVKGKSDPFLYDFARTLTSRSVLYLRTQRLKEAEQDANDALTAYQALGAPKLRPYSYALD